jgi:hypothetical protein
LRSQEGTEQKTLVHCWFCCILHGQRVIMLPEGRDRVGGAFPFRVQHRTKLWCSSPILIRQTAIAETDRHLSLLIILLQVWSVTVNTLSIHRKYVFNPLYPETFSLPSSDFFPLRTLAQWPRPRWRPDEVEDTSGRGFLAQGAAASW